VSGPYLDAIGIVVSDMARTLEFYRLLGLEFGEGSESEGHVETTLPSGVRLMFDTEELMKSFDDGFEMPESSGRVSLAFVCGSTGEVDSLYASIVDAGFDGHLDPFDAFWGQRYATVLDPDGTKVDLFAPLEAA
jgi:uncharacterized glyoxalase superfamily protein PhnB